MAETFVPFFSRLETTQLISRLSRKGPWTIYIGAGGSVDRTGLTWAGLVDNLLAPHVADPELRRAVIEQHGEQRAATIACDLYGESEDPNARRRIIQRIRADLYGHPKHMAGRMLEFVARLTTVLWQSDQPIVIVTPNFDSHLLDELALEVGHDIGDARFKDIVVHHIASLDSPEHLEENLRDGSRIIFVSLHGYIPQEDGERQLHPVVSEADYQRTYDASKSTLKACFDERNLLILGSSMTDPPLLAALAEAANSSSRHRKEGDAHRRDVEKYERVAVLPLQGGEWSKVPPHLRSGAVELTSTRLRALGVTAAFPDYFIQVGQLVQEVSTCLQFADGMEYGEFAFPRRYDNRIKTWWAAWESAVRDVLNSQAEDHRYLAHVLNDLRDHLESPASEALKLELWARWEPYSGRRLALWASSVGTWIDFRSMRWDDITSQSPYRSVSVFCNGAPTFMEGNTDDASRWKTYLGVPIWHDGENGSVPVGVISLAAMRPDNREAETSLRLQARGLAAVIDYMRSAGETLLSRGRLAPMVPQMAAPEPLSDAAS